MLAKTSAEAAKLPFETNFFGVVRMISEAAPIMISQKHGHIINIGSIAGRIGVPFHGIYSASKAAIETYTESLRMEMHRHGVHVSLIEPGDLRPGGDTISGPGIESDLAAKKAMEIMKKEEANGTDPVKVAQTVERILKSSNPAPRHLVGLDAWLVWACERVFSRAMCEWFLMDHYKVPKQ